MALKRGQKIITADDHFEIAKLVDKDWQYKAVQKYLKEGGKEIKLVNVKEGGHDLSFHVYLDGRDISGNGYCYSPEKLMRHISVYERFKSELESDDYKLYEKFKRRFKDIETFFNK